MREPSIHADIHLDDATEVLHRLMEEHIFGDDVPPEEIESIELARSEIIYASDDKSVSRPSARASVQAATAEQSIVAGKAGVVPRSEVPRDTRLLWISILRKYPI